MKHLGKFWVLERGEKLLFCESLLLHLYVGLLLKVVPFRQIPRLFRSPQFAVGTWQPEAVENVKVALQRAGWISPWKNRCLVSSLAGRIMLRRRRIPSGLFLGVAKQPDGKTIAHAWLMAAGYEVIEKRSEYTELYTF